MAWGKGEAACGSWQYSQRELARCQTNRSSAGFMHGIHAGAFEGEPCPGPEDTEPVSYPAIILDFGLLGGRKIPLLSLERKFTHPCLVLFAKLKAEEFAGCFGREIAVVGFDQPTDDGGFTGS